MEANVRAMKRMLAALFRLDARQAILMGEKLQFFCGQRADEHY
jgi:hypothetical protein